MTFLSGAALWLLGLTALVIFVYFLKRQARLQPVSTLFLWKLVEQNPKNALRMQWTRLLSLILQLAALIALVTGLAQPVIHSISGGVSRLAIVLDGSASMRALVPAAGTGQNNISRFQKGTALAQEILGKNAAAEVTLIQAQERSVILSAPTKNHNAIRRALSNREPSYQGDAEIGDLLGLLQSQSSQSYERVVFITDKRPESNLELYGWDVLLVNEHELANVAITDFSVREQPNGRGYDFYIKAYNSNNYEIELPLAVEADSNIVRQQSVKIPAQGAVAISFPGAASHAKRFTARLDTTNVENSWNEDDVRYATTPRPLPWKIMWIGPTNFFLESFLKETGEVALTRISEWDESIRLDEYDVVLLYQTSLPTAQAGRFLVVGASYGSWIESAGVRELTTGAIDVESDHALLEGIDPTPWRLLHLPDVTVNDKGKTLLSSEGVPFLYLYEKPGLKLTYIGVDLEASNLVFSIDFPILMYRLIHWLAPRPGINTTLFAGQELPLKAMDGMDRVINPQGRSCDYEPGKGECGQVDQPGFYQTLRTDVEGLDPLEYAVNPAPGESIWSAQAADGTGSAGISSSSTSATSSLQNSARELKMALPIWPYLLIIGALLLLAEQLLFSRAALPIPISFDKLRRRA